MTTSIEVGPVGPAQVETLQGLFESARTTRHCWCMAFCRSRLQLAAGWFGGGNQRSFVAMAQEGTPMGVMATIAGLPVGWGACGPRARYLRSSPVRPPLLASSRPEEDETAWLLPCLFVRAEHRGQGVSHVLVAGAVSLARRHRAVAMEAWPLSAAAKGHDQDAFVGREQLFAEMGFRCVGRPDENRVVMRLEIDRSSAC